MRFSASEYRTEVRALLKRLVADEIALKEDPAAAPEPMLRTLGQLEKALKPFYLRTKYSEAELVQRAEKKRREAQEKRERERREAQEKRERERREAREKREKARKEAELAQRQKIAESKNRVGCTVVGVSFFLAAALFFWSGENLSGWGMLAAIAVGIGGFLVGAMISG